MEQLQARQRVQRAPAVVRRQEPASSATIVFSIHYLEEADASAERIMVRAGKVVTDGTPGSERLARLEQAVFQRPA